MLYVVAHMHAGHALKSAQWVPQHFDHACDCVSSSMLSLVLSLSQRIMEDGNIFHSECYDILVKAIDESKNQIREKMKGMFGQETKMPSYHSKTVRIAKTECQVFYLHDSQMSLPQQMHQYQNSYLECIRARM